MKFKILFFLIFQILSFSIFAQKFEKTGNPELLPEIKVYASGKVENIYLEAKSINSKAEPTAEFDVTYTGFSEDAKVAFKKATEIWSYLISSPVPIKIDARWEVMESGVLGSSGPPTMFKNFKNVPFKDTWYHPCVANRLAGYDLDPESYDMITTFNKDYSWYLGTDGDCPNDETDFITIVLHEIAHGLGFSSGAYKDSIEGGMSFFSWDQYMYNSGDSLLMDSNLFENPSSELLDEFTSREIYFDSPLSNQANGGTPAELYAPSIWNEGSSISHLGEKYNYTDNALMTYAAGTGEVLHDPGPITMGMLHEIGWNSVRFEHKGIKDIEVMSNPITVETEVYADSAVYTDSVFVYYSTNKFATENIISMTTTNDIVFKADIPVVSADTVWYYLKAKNTLDRWYYYPSQGELNPENINSVLNFAIGLDNTVPEIIHVQEEEFLFNYEEALSLEVEADDNVGIDSVFIEYKFNSNPLNTLKLNYEGENPYGLPKYTTQIPINEETLSYGDTIYYTITAVDSSSNANSVTKPENGYFKVAIQSLLEPKSDTIINFQSSDDAVFIFNGLTVEQPAGFSSLALHSPHPYEEGDPYPGDQIEYSAMLKMPIIISSDSAYLQFEEIVLVEPGSDGAQFEDFEFWDYVIVEASKDTGATWHALNDGYDCSISTSFTSAFNSGANGIPSMYELHVFNLVSHTGFVANDTVLIRFRLWSDQAAVGWGWAIDDLRIQKNIDGPTSAPSMIAEKKHKFKIYPNPAREYITLDYKSDDMIDDITLSIYSLDGKMIYSQTKKINGKTIHESINIEQINKGYYILRLQSGAHVVTERLLIQ